MNALLFDRPPLIINIELAQAIGLNESIVLQQLHYQLHSNTAKEADGRKWTNISLKDWKEKAFAFWNIATIEKAVKGLKKQGLVISNGALYSINEERLHQAMNRTPTTVKDEYVNAGDYAETSPDNNSVLDTLKKAGIELNKFTKPAFEDYVNKFGSDLVKYAIKRTAFASARPTVNYLFAVLNDYEKKGIETVEEAKEADGIFQMIRGHHSYF